MMGCFDFVHVLGAGGDLLAMMHAFISELSYTNPT